MKSSTRVLVAGVVLLVGSAACAQSFNAQAPLTGTGTYTRTVDVSNDGLRAIGYGDDGGTMRPFDWFYGGSYIIMSWHGTPGGGYFTLFPTGVDATASRSCGYGDRSVLVTPPFGFQVGPRAYREDALSGANNFPVPMLAYADFSDARGISDDGDVVVGRQYKNVFEYAYRFTYSTFQLQDLGTLPAQFGAAALAVSGDGNTVVGRSGTQAFSWRPSEGMLSLGSLPGQSSAVATCVGANGLTIAGTSYNGTDRGFRWSPLVGMQQLPMLAGGVHLRPHAMDANGVIIGGQSVDAAGTPTAFIWTPTLGTQTLVSHLVGRGLFGQLGGVVPTDVTGMSADGRAICGLGTSGGIQVGWVARGLQCATMGGTAGTQYACAGGNVTLNATGPSGGPGQGLSSFQWYKNSVLVVAGTQAGGSYIADASAYNLYITGVTASDVGNYYCIASSAGACPVQGPTTNLQIQGAPTIALQPVATAGCVNQLVSLTTLGVPVSGTAVYRWQRHVPPFPNVYADIFDGPTGNGSNYVGTASATFSVQNAQVADTEYYRCIVSDSTCGAGNYASTDRVLLTVSGNTTVLGPVDTAGCLGDNDVSLSVSATPANVTYQWQRHLPPHPSAYFDIFDGPTGNGGYYGGTQTATLTLSGLFAADMQRYRCVVTGPCSSVVSAPAQLSGYSPPAIAGHPVDDYVCQYHGTAVFTVVPGLGNFGPLNYQWFKANVALVDGPAPGGHTYAGATTATLVVGTVSPSAAGSYYCEITAPCGFAFSHPAVLTYCPGDFNCDGVADFFDYVDFVDAYTQSVGPADFNGDGFVDFFDYLDFVDAFSVGCT